MYIWVGIDVDDQLSEIKKQAVDIEQEVCFSNSCFTLPLHISLKMSFPTRQPEAVIEAIAAFYQGLRAFDVSVKGLEDEGCILWIRMAQNDTLDGIHDRLNEMLSRDFQIGLHQYDTDYKFHTTLFMDDDPKKIHNAFRLLSSASLPASLHIHRFVIGVSESGRLGSYRVIREICV